MEKQRVQNMAQIEKQMSWKHIVKTPCTERLISLRHLPTSLYPWSRPLQRRSWRFLRCQANLWPQAMLMRQHVAPAGQDRINM